MATPAGTDADDEAAVVVMPLTATLYVVPPPVTVPTWLPPTSPLNETSPVAKPVTASLKTTVKSIGEVLVGSLTRPG